MEMSAWLPQPVMFQSPRTFTCKGSGFTPEQCDFYTQRWHFWYIADLVYALPTIAFFLCAIGLFIIANVLTKLLGQRRQPQSSLWKRGLATARYLSYRGFRVESIRWNTAPVGLLLLGLIGTVYFFCMDLVPSPYYWPGSDTLWGNSPPLGTRSGWLSLACMPFVFATATKTNWITLVTGVSHEKLQVFHRWISYAFFVLALMHTFPFIVWHTNNGDMAAQFSVMNVFEYWTGILALVFQAWLTFASWGPFRKLGYEFFKATHFLAIVIFIVVFFWHCDGTLTSWHYFVATAAVYVPCWAYPWMKTFFEHKLGQKAELQVESNNFLRITISGNFVWTPGQHCFLRFPGFGLHAFSSHPFTICSMPPTMRDVTPQMTFLVRPQGGLTKHLYNYAIQQPGARVSVLIDGPYGGIDNQQYFSSDRLAVIAGGSGAGWVLPLVEQFLQLHSHNKRLESSSSSSDSSSADEKEPIVSNTSQRTSSPRVRSVRVVLATRDIATRIWFHAALNDLMAKYISNEAVSAIEVEVHMTGRAEDVAQQVSGTVVDNIEPLPESHRHQDASATTTTTTTKGGANGEGMNVTSSLVKEEELCGRPDCPAIIRQESAAAASAGWAIGFYCCGPLSMQSEVRNAVAAENLNIMKGTRGRSAYLHLEHFSWA